MWSTEDATKAYLLFRILLSVYYLTRRRHFFAACGIGLSQILGVAHFLRDVGVIVRGLYLVIFDLLVAFGQCTVFLNIVSPAHNSLHHGSRVYYV